MPEIKLSYVTRYRDRRDGKMRYQFRRKGFKRIMLRGKVGSAEFMAQYAELLAQSEKPIAHVGASRTKPGTIDALVVKYLDHAAFKGLADTTQATRRRILDHFRNFKTPSGRRYGDARFSTMIEDDIYPVLKGKPPTVQRDWMKAIRHLIAFAIEQCKKLRHSEKEEEREFATIFAIKKDPTIGITPTNRPGAMGTSLGATSRSPPIVSGTHSAPWHAWR